MLNLVVLSTLVALAAAKPGYFDAAPIGIAEGAYPAAAYAAAPIGQGYYDAPIAQGYYGAPNVFASAPAHYSAPIAHAHFAAAPVAVAKQVVAAPVAVAKPVVHLAEPQDVSYTRTDVVSKKVTAKAPQATYIGGGPVETFLENAVPHAIKNIHYAEENFASGPPGQQIGNTDYGLRGININIPPGSAPGGGVELGRSGPGGPPQGPQQGPPQG